MLAAKYRYHGYGALKFLFGKGRTFRFKSLSVRAAPNPRRSNSRVAVIVSKKVLKAAPKRNRVRRRVYEAIRQNWQHIAAGHDILISVYDPQFVDLPHEEAISELVKALKTAGVWVLKKQTPPEK